MPHTTKDSAGHTVHDTETASTGRSGGSGKVGDAMRSVRGVGETIHGFGENIRGTALGAVDTISKDKNTGNDEIAERGRLEAQRGMADVGHGKTSHHGVQSSSTYPTQSSYGSSTTSGTTGLNQGGFQEGTSPGGAQPYGAASATQGRESYPTQYGSANEQGSRVGTAGQESTIHPGQGQQLHEVQPAAHQQPYNPAQNPNVGSAYGQDSYQPTSAANQERR